jgi:tetratricopeptide (TPR) repeat protein
LAAGDPSRAERVVERALQAAEAYRDPRVKAGALAEIARALSHADEPQQAEGIAERALRAAELVEQTPEEVPFWRSSMVETLIQAGKFEHALRAAAPIARASSKSASLLIEIAGALARAQRFDNALEITETIEDPVSRAFALAEIGSALAQFGQRMHAAQLLQRVLDAAGATSDAKDRVILLCAAAKALAKAVDRERAKQIVHQAMHIVETIDDPELQILANVRVLESLIRVGEPDQALSIAHGLSDSNRDFALTGMAVAASEVDDFASAVKAADAIGDSTERVLAFAWITEALAEAGERKRAAELAERALSVAESLGDTSRKVWGLRTLSRTLFLMEEFTQAKRSLSVTLMAASSLNRSEYLRALGDVSASIGKAFQGKGETLWDVCEAICEADDWWFDR